MEQGDKRKDCCKQPENLVPHQERPDLVVSKCKVCGCRHFELTVNPGRVGMKGAALMLALLLFLPVVVLAQTVSFPVNSIWSFTEDQRNSLAATLLRKNATTGNLEAIPGQRIALEQMKITYGQVLVVPVSMAATFPGQKTSPMTVWGVRMFHSAVGTGWSMPEHPINVTFPTALAVPAGRKVACVYNMPVREMGNLACSVAPQ